MRDEDPVVERVRETRSRIVEQCGRNPHRMFELAKQIEEAHRERVVGYEPPAQATLDRRQ